MKRQLILLFVATTLSANIFGQEVDKKFTPYYLINGKVENFEKAGAKSEAKSIGMGYGGVNSYHTILNSKNSSVRFSSVRIPKFIIEIEDNTETYELVVIVKADVTNRKKTYRRFVQSGAGLGGSKDLSEHFYIPNLKKIEGNLYEMTFEQDLPPGEYSFKSIPISGKNYMTSSGKILTFCFGID